MRRVVAVVFSAFVLTACGGDAKSDATVTVDTLPGGIVRTMSSGPIAPGTLSLVSTLEIQPEADSPAELLNPESVAVADDGSIIVSESEQGQIKVFGPDGEFVREFGRRGSGPNEYQAAFLAVHGDTLLVQDPGSSRFSRVLWRTGEFVSQVVSVCCYWAAIDVDADGYAWVLSINNAPDTTFVHSQGFLRIPVTVGPVDTVWAYERKELPKPPFWAIRVGGQVRMTMAIPFQPRADFTPDPAGRLLTGWTGEYSIRESTDGVDTVAIFGRAWAPEPVAAAEKQQLVDARVAAELANRGPFDEATFRNAMDPALIPNTRPAYTMLHVDRSGRRWVQLESADTTRTSFDVFSRDGRWLDIVHVPREHWLRDMYTVAWGRDRVVVAQEDEDGRPLLRVFRIEAR